MNVPKRGVQRHFSLGSNSKYINHEKEVQHINRKELHDNFRRTVPRRTKSSDCAPSCVYNSSMRSFGSNNSSGRSHGSEVQHINRRHLHTDICRRSVPRRTKSDDLGGFGHSSHHENSSLGRLSQNASAGDQKRRHHRRHSFGPSLIRRLSKKKVTEDKSIPTHVLAPGHHSSHDGPRYNSSDESSETNDTYESHPHDESDSRSRRIKSALSVLPPTSNHHIETKPPKTKFWLSPTAFEIYFVLIFAGLTHCIYVLHGVTIVVMCQFAFVAIKWTKFMKDNKRIKKKKFKNPLQQMIIMGGKACGELNKALKGDRKRQFALGMAIKAGSNLPLKRQAEIMMREKTSEMNKHAIESDFHFM